MKVKCGRGRHEIFLFLKGGNTYCSDVCGGGGEFSESQQNSRSPLEEKTDTFLKSENSVNVSSCYSFWTKNVILYFVFEF